MHTYMHMCACARTHTHGQALSSTYPNSKRAKMCPSADDDDDDDDLWIQDQVLSIRQVHLKNLRRKNPRK